MPRVLELTAGRGAEVVVENAARDNLDADIALLAQEGRIVLIGPGTGKEPSTSLNVQSAMGKNARILGLATASLGARVPEAIRRLSPLLEVGGLRLHVGLALPLEEAEEAHPRPPQRKVFGENRSRSVEDAGMAKRPVIALTMGDPAGVGPEVCLKAAREARVLRCCLPLIVGDLGVLRAHARGMRLPGGLRAVPAGDVPPPPSGPSDPVSVLDLANVPARQRVFGKVRAALGRAAGEYVERAVALVREGRAAAIATAPLNKEASRRAGIPIRDTPRCWRAFWVPSGR